MDRRTPGILAQLGLLTHHWTAAEQHNDLRGVPSIALPTERNARYKAYESDHHADCLTLIAVNPRVPPSSVYLCTCGTNSTRVTKPRYPRRKTRCVPCARRSSRLPWTLDPKSIASGRGEPMTTRHSSASRPMISIRRGSKPIRRATTIEARHSSDDQLHEMIKQPQHRIDAVSPPEYATTATQRKTARLLASYSTTLPAPVCSR